MARSFTLTAAIEEYILDHSRPADPVLTALAERTSALGSVAGMQIGADQGALLTMLTRLVRARFAVEVGTFTGYSSVCIARGLGAGGRLLCCDVSEDWTDIAKDAWDQAGVADRIELVIAPGTETLATLGTRPPVDFAFIDADKPNYVAYYEAALGLVRPGGLILVDNVLWGGSVADPADTTPDAEAIRALNETVHADPRVEPVIVPIGDGLTVARVVG